MVEVKTIVGLERARKATQTKLVGRGGGAWEAESCRCIWEQQNVGGIPQNFPRLLSISTTYHPKLVKGYPRWPTSATAYTSTTLHGSQSWPLETSGREQGGPEVN